MKYFKLIIISFLFLIGFSGCSLILSKMYGVNYIDDFNRENYEKFLSSIEIKKYESIVCDSIDFTKIISLGNTKKQKNDLGQPVQILYFEGNLLKSYHANCYAKGSMTNLNWNTEHRFDFFPPISALDKDSISLTLNDFEKKLQIEMVSEKNDYTIIIFWTLMLEKVSKSAINIVNENLTKYNGNNNSNVKIYLVNTDKYFSKL